MAATAAACVCVCLAHVDMIALFVTLQERSGNNSFTHEALNLKYKLDNEFELIFVVSSHLMSASHCAACRRHDTDQHGATVSAVTHPQPLCFLLLRWVFKRS